MEEKINPKLPKENSKSLSEQLNEIKSAILETRVQSEPLPKKARISAFRKKAGWISVLYILNNKNGYFLRGKIDDGTVNVNDLLHHVSPEDIIQVKGQPLVIIPEWNINPVRAWNAGEDLEKASKEGNLTLGQRYVMAKMMKGVIKSTKKASWFWLLIMLAAAGALLYFLTKEGGIF